MMSLVCSGPRCPLSVEMIYWLKSRSSFQPTPALVQSPLAQRALPLLHPYYGLMCRSFALPAISLLRLIGRVLAAWAIHGWSEGPSQLYPVVLSGSAASLTPGLYRVRVSVSSPITSASPLSYCARQISDTPQTASRG